MHIPDGYLSPQTFIPAWAAMLALWTWASRRVKQTLRMRRVPMLALAAAFSFVIMMFNIPFGPSSGHAVGAVLIAILLGPWEALIAVSLALGVQALVFQDGGITTLAANCLNMAVIMPFTGWGIYRLIVGKARSGARPVAAAIIAGYLGLVVSAISTAVMFGIQPLIAHDAAGRALFNAYPLQVAVPVMAIEHLLIFGPIEAIVTGLVVASLLRTSPELFTQPEVTGKPSLLRKAAIALAVLVLLTPLGLLATGTAWGEWGLGEVRQMIGYLPAGMARFDGIWKAPLPGYAETPAGYILSAIIGAGLLALLGWGIHRYMAGKESHDLSS